MQTLIKSYALGFHRSLCRMNIAHFVITRFNLPLRGWTKDKNNVSVATDTWMARRIDLFRTFCLPTLASQTTRQFTWLVLFNDKTAEQYKRLNEQLQHEYAFYKPLYLSDEQTADLPTYLSGQIKAVTDAEYVVTTRMDNDDALAIDAIEEIQSCVKSTSYKQPYAVSLPNGIQFYTQYNLSMWVNYKANHFLSLVERKSERYKTVYDFSHVEVSKRYPVVCAGKNRNMWMEVCHESNLDNDVHLKWAFRPIKHSFEVERFRITPPPERVQLREIQAVCRISKTCKNKIETAA